MKIAFATCNDKPNGTKDDQLLQKHLLNKDHNVEFKIWSDQNTDWSKFDLTIIRSTWNYYQNVDEFLSWSQRVSSVSQLCNSYETLKWNCSKHYLLELEKSGVTIIPTQIYSDLDTAIEATQEFFKEHDRIAVKPAVSASADLTFCFEKTDSEKIKQALVSILERSDVLIQPFVNSISEIGELSLMYFSDGNNYKFSHAVQKLVKPGDYRVQDDFGGSVESFTASPKLIEFGLNTLSTLPSPVSYARVDIVDWNSPTPLLGELELIEPELFFRFSDSSVSDFSKSLNC